MPAQPFGAFARGGGVFLAAGFALAGAHPSPGREVDARSGSGSCPVRSRRAASRRRACRPQGSSSSSSISREKGPVSSSTRSDSVAIVSSRKSICASICPTRRAWWPVKRPWSASRSAGIFVRRTRLIGARPSCSPTGATTASRPTARSRRSSPTSITATTHGRVRGPRPRGPSARALPLRPHERQQRLDRDRRARAQPRTLGNPDRPPQPPRPDRPLPPPPTPRRPRPPDPFQPPMDSADARRAGPRNGRSPPSSTDPARSPPSPGHPRRRPPAPANPAAGTPRPTHPARNRVSTRFCTLAFPRERFALGQHRLSDRHPGKPVDSTSPTQPIGGSRQPGSTERLGG